MIINDIKVKSHDQKTTKYGFGTITRLKLHYLCSNKDWLAEACADQGLEIMKMVTLFYVVLHVCFFFFNSRHIWMRRSNDRIRKEECYFMLPTN